MKEDGYKQYDNKFARLYMDSQEKFHAKTSDVTGEALYSQIDFPLKGKRLLDAGCGYGRYLKHFQKAGAIVYGIDASRAMVELALEHNPNLKTLSVQRMEKTSFKSNFFDVIVSRFAIQHAKNLTPVFEELHRILKPGGYLIFIGNHPMFLFEAKKDKRYDKQEIVELRGFGAVIIREPTHTFSEHISEFVLRNFELISFQEKAAWSKEASNTNIDGARKGIPEFIVVKLRKKKV